MQPKMTTSIARDYVARLEALEAQRGDIHAEIVQKYHEGPGALSVICDAVKARASMREEEYNAGALLDSFDAPEVD